MFGFWDSLLCSGWSQTHYIVHAGFKLKTVFLPQFQIAGIAGIMETLVAVPIHEI